MKTMIDPEVQIAADIAAAEARGEDPYADKAQSEDQGGNITSPTGKVVIPDEPETPAEVVDEVVNETPAEVADEEVVEPAKDQPTSYRTSLPEDYKAQRSTLIAEKAAVMKQLMDGEMDAEEFAVAEARISDSLEDLTAQRIRAETLQEANTQTRAAYQSKEIQKLITRTKGEVDYATEAKAQRQFDLALSAVSQDPDFADKDYTDQLVEAHRVVLALRGVVPTKLKTERPDRPAAKQPPQTLAGLPTAASTGARSVEQTLSSLSGLDFEAAFAQLPKAEQDRLLKS